METDVKFENTSDCYVTFCPGIEENDVKILEVTQDEVIALRKGVENVLK